MIDAKRNDETFHAEMIVGTNKIKGKYMGKTIEEEGKA